MLKITKRLDSKQEEEYIKKVALCMRRKKATEAEQFLKDFNKNIVIVLQEIKKSGDYVLYNRIIDYMKEWKLHHRTFQINLYKTRNVKISHCVMAWIVMSQELMRDIRSRVKNVCNINLHKDKRWETCYALFRDKEVNNWIIEIVDNKVCPYCNLSFIYNRSPKKTTAELDHFYNKSDYPLFALNYYNLIPVCHSCNHIKSNQDEDIVSPYDNNAYNDLMIDYDFIDETKIDYIDLESNIQIIFNGSEQNKKHIKQLKIDEAYGQVKDYAEELIQKLKIFNNKAARELIQDGIEISISTTEFEQVYFGRYRYEPEKRILGKMTYDFLKKYLKY